MMHRPFYSIGLVFHATLEPRPTFLGCSFAFLSPRRFVTAAHCLGSLAPDQLRVVLPLVDQSDLGRVSEIARHPVADLAVVTTTEAAPGVQPFRGLSALRGWGEAVMAVGYPEETQDDKTIPTGRLFSGTIQRIAQHRSHMSYVYRAGELSFGSPAGLSGGPVFPTAEMDRVLGVVTENHNATTFLQSLSEIQDGDHRYSEKVHEMIRYGLFVDLEDVHEWLVQACTD